jgi:hypothetical protein
MIQNQKKGKGLPFWVRVEVWAKKNDRTVCNPALTDDDMDREDGKGMRLIA